MGWGYLAVCICTDFDRNGQFQPITGHLIQILAYVGAATVMLRLHIGEYLDEVTGYWLKGDQMCIRDSPCGA